MELPRGREVDRPHIILCPFHRLLCLFGGFDSEDVFQQPPLCGQKLFPPVPLRHNPASEVLALHDHFAGRHR
ncbi:hypothetical protein [Streptomyces sp. NPDC015350]|uniref:hypothetical protein n=1 Tax=Streptomyces sp. NPDC015350 TaxID=3364955 RepID=UPI003702058F